MLAVLLYCLDHCRGALAASHVFTWTAVRAPSNELKSKFPRQQADTHTSACHAEKAIVNDVKRTDIEHTANP